MGTCQFEEVALAMSTLPAPNIGAYQKAHRKLGSLSQDRRIAEHNFWIAELNPERFAEFYTAEKLHPSQQLVAV